MAELDILSNVDRIKSHWETKTGLLYSFTFLIVVYFVLSKYFELEKIPNYNIWYSITILTTLLLLLFIYWIWDTNRFFIRFNDRITCGVILIADNDRDKLVVNKIISKVIDKINNSNVHVKLKLLPTNFCEHEKQVNRYHKNYDFMYDLIVRVFVESGNYESIEKIKITRLSVTFRSKSGNTQKRIFYNTVDLISDMALQVRSRDWEYLMHNDGIDRNKYLGNLYHILLYYLGFYSIYSDRHNVALSIMSPIYNEKNTKLFINKKEDGSQKLTLTSSNLAAGRLATILTDLYFYSAVKSYEQSRIGDALNNFVKLEKLIKNHPKKFEQFINMARYSYELGDQEKAIHYTKQAQNISPNRLEIFVNLGFFAIVNGNVSEFCKNYRSIYLYRNTYSIINWLDVIDFLQKQEITLAQRVPFLNFSINFIEYIFIQSINVKEFDSIINKFQNDEHYLSFYNLGKWILLKEKPVVKNKQKQLTGSSTTYKRKRRRK